MRRSASACARRSTRCRCAPLRPRGGAPVDKLRIRGGRPLEGEVRVSGAKNAALPIMCAALLSSQPLRLTNVPQLMDVRTMAKLLRQMGGSAETPICRRSLAMVRTSISCGTLVRRSGCELRSAAHMIGSAAFFAPETRTSPSSGRPPRMRSLSTGAPFLRGERAHGERVDLLAHALAERGIDQLVALHAVAPGKFH